MNPWKNSPGSAPRLYDVRLSLPSKEGKCKQTHLAQWGSNRAANMCIQLRALQGLGDTDFLQRKRQKQTDFTNSMKAAFANDKWRNGGTSLAES